MDTIVALKRRVAETIKSEPIPKARRLANLIMDLPQFSDSTAYGLILRRPLILIKFAREQVRLQMRGPKIDYPANMGADPALWIRGVDEEVEELRELTHIHLQRLEWDSEFKERIPDEPLLDRALRLKPVYPMVLGDKKSQRFEQAFLYFVTRASVYIIDELTNQSRHRELKTARDQTEHVRRVERLRSHRRHNSDGDVLTPLGHPSVDDMGDPAQQQYGGPREYQSWPFDSFAVSLIDGVQLPPDPLEMEFFRKRNLLYSDSDLEIVRQQRRIAHKTSMLIASGALGRFGAFVQQFHAAPDQDSEEGRLPFIGYTEGKPDDMLEAQISAWNRLSYIAQDTVYLIIMIMHDYNDERPWELQDILTHPLGLFAIAARVWGGTAGDARRLVATSTLDWGFTERRNDRGHVSPTPVLDKRAESVLRAYLAGLEWLHTMPAAATDEEAELHNMSLFKEWSEQQLFSMPELGDVPFESVTGSQQQAENSAVPPDTSSASEQVGFENLCILCCGPLTGPNAHPTRELQCCGQRIGVACFARIEKPRRCPFCRVTLEDEDDDEENKEDETCSCGG